MGFAFRKGRARFHATVYRLFLLNVGCPQKLPNTNTERILLSGVILANVTLVGIFSGILYNSFAHDMYYPDIASLHDLDASELPITLTSGSLNDVFGSEDDTDSTVTDMVMKSLREKLKYGRNSLQNAAYHRNVCGIIRESFLPIFNEEFIDKDGSPLIHLIQECPGMNVFFLPLTLREKQKR